MARIDFFTGLGLMTLAVGVYVVTLDMIQVERGIGPGDYPRVAAVGLLVLGAILAVQSGLKLLKGKTTPLVIPRPARLRVFLMVVMIFAYIWLMRWTGFVLITPVFLFVTMLFFGLRKYLLAALTSLGITLVLFVTFRYGFQVMLPVAGLFGLL